MSRLIVQDFVGTRDNLNNGDRSPIRMCSCLKLIPFFVFAGFFTACIPGKKLYTPTRKIAPELLQQDTRVLWETLGQCHPGLYWYTPQEAIDSAFEALLTACSDSLTESEYRKQLSRAVALIHCGHTSVRTSKAAAHYRQHKRSSFFPLQLKTWGGDSAVIVANIYGSDSILTRGTSVQCINGMPIEDILDSICQYISADGLHNNFKYQLISNNFPAWYGAIIGQSNSYLLEVTTLEGSPAFVNIKNYDPAYEDSVRFAKDSTERQFLRRPRKRRPGHGRLSSERKLTIDSARSLAVMELNTFSRAHLPRFFRKTFKMLRKQNIRNLAIELRDNGGGNIMNSTRLDRYLVDHPFHVADTVFAKSLHYPYPRLVQNGVLYKIQSWFATRRRADQRLHYRLYERKQFSPFKRNHFDGRVFIITGGFTFSASTLFINPLKEQKNVQVIGEETGGCAYGNNAVNLPDLTLPNTKVRVRLPLYRLVINSKLPHNGRGILPDVPLPPTSWHLAHRLDPKMQYIYDVIEKEKAQASAKH